MSYYSLWKEFHFTVVFSFEFNFVKTASKCGGSELSVISFIKWKERFLFYNMQNASSSWFSQIESISLNFAYTERLFKL